MHKEIGSDFLTGMVDGVTRHLRQGDRVRINGWEQVRKRKARTGRNPATGERCRSLPAKRLHFARQRNSKGGLRWNVHRNRPCSPRTDGQVRAKQMLASLGARTGPTGCARPASAHGSHRFRVASDAPHRPLPATPRPAKEHHPAGIELAAGGGRL